VYLLLTPSNGGGVTIGPKQLGWRNGEPGGSNNQDPTRRPYQPVPTVLSIVTTTLMAHRTLPLTPSWSPREAGTGGRASSGGSESASAPAPRPQAAQ